MKILFVLFILLILFYMLNVKEEYQDLETYNPTKFGLIQRNEIPTDLKHMLNASNPPTIRFQIPVALPDMFDVREKWGSLITAPLDQEKCGSCWAFAICTASADRIRINIPAEKHTFNQMIEYRGFKGIYKALNNLDPFHLAACNLCDVIPSGTELSKNALCGIGPKSTACKGQIMQVALQYLKIRGTIDVLCSPRQASCVNDSSLCFYSCDHTNCPLYKPTEIHPLSDDFAQEYTRDVEKDNLIKYEIFHYGPVVAGYKVMKSFMDFFKDPKNSQKVYSSDYVDTYDNDQLLGGHAIVIGGWGVDEDTGINYWLIRNSWGQDWADKGWFKLERGTNFMDIGTDVWSMHWRDTKI